MNRPVSFKPCSYARSNSGRRRTRSCRERRSVTGRWLVLPLVRDGETFPTSGPAALQHDTAVLCRHPHAKAVCLATAARIGLKRALPLCHLDCVLHELSVETSSRQTPNTSRRLTTLSKTESISVAVLQFAGVASGAPWFGVRCSPFGFSPKISTPVENIVEKQMKRSSYCLKRLIFMDFRHGEGLRMPCFRAFGSSAMRFARH